MSFPFSKVGESERVGRFLKLAGNEFQADGAMKRTERSATDFRLHLEIFKTLLAPESGDRLRGV